MASIYKRGSKWRGQIILGERRISVSGKTKKEVQAKLAEIETDFNRGNYVFTNEITVQEWTDCWLKSKENKMLPQSYNRLCKLFENHLYPYLGDKKIQDLTKYEIEGAYANSFHEKTGKKYKEPEYSHATVNALSFQFKTCLQEAVNQGYLLKNPHNGVELHKLRPPKKVHAYTMDEHKKIVAYTKSKDKYAIFYLLISTGMRVGEACALSWDDVDLEKGTININKTAISDHGSMLIQDHPKTNQSVRTIHASQSTIAWLKELRDRQPDVNIHNLVVPTSISTVQSPANLRKYWKKACLEMNIPYYGLHALRHTWATRALEQNIDVKIVSDMLGHKNVITTMNIYQEVLDTHREEAAKKMNSLF